jgi:hypothetical protein
MVNKKFNFKNHFMKLLKPLLFFSAIVLLGFTTENNTNQQWILIGEKKVSFLVDRDVIHVTGNDNYSQLKVKVKDGPVHIIDMDVHFENGDKFDVSLKQRIPKGGESRVIDLPGGSRNVRKIAFWYETKGFRKGRGTVQVWGKR